MYWMAVLLEMRCFSSRQVGISGCKGYNCTRQIFTSEERSLKPEISGFAFAFCEPVCLVFGSSTILVPQQSLCALGP